MSDLGRTEDDDGMTPAERRGFGGRPKGGFSPSQDGIAGLLHPVVEPSRPVCCCCYARKY